MFSLSAVSSKQEAKCVMWQRTVIHAKLFSNLKHIWWRNTETS